MFDDDEIIDDSLEPETVQKASKNEVDSELGQTRMEVAYGPRKHAYHLCRSQS